MPWDSRIASWEYDRQSDREWEQYCAEREQDAEQELCQQEEDGWQGPCHPTLCGAFLGPEHRPDLMPGWDYEELCPF